MAKILRRLCCFVFILLTCLTLIYPAFSSDLTNEEIPLNKYGIRSTNPYVVDRFVLDGKTIDKIIVPGFPHPPAEFVRASAAMLPAPDKAAGINIITSVPASTWAFGCSATSAAMMFGHYDNAGYPNMYTGPTNGGVFPMTNETWGTASINGETRALNPLSATRNGLDGRVIKGHVDDYWVKYGNSGDDPFFGSWTEHTKGECTADYMGTNQDAFENSDGSTTFWNYNNGSPLYDYVGAEPSGRDGCHGMKLFVQSRGYTVQANGNFNQYIYGYDGNTLGFTFANFKAEINAGRPVLIQVEGHTMLGYGYNETGSIVYIHDTWDYSDHTMTWGGSYSGMQHYAVTVLRLADPPVAPPTAVTNAATTVTMTGTTLNGSVNANNASTTVTFEYGTTTAYGTTVTAVQSPVTGHISTAVSKSITGLTPDTPYHYRVVGVNSEGTTNGNDMTFTSLPPIMGDLDNNRQVTIADAILGLKVTSGWNVDGINTYADVNGDGKIGLAEVLYILQDLAGLR